MASSLFVIRCLSGTRKRDGEKTTRKAHVDEEHCPCKALKEHCIGLYQIVKNNVRPLTRYRNDDVEDKETRGVQSSSLP